MPLAQAISLLLGVALALPAVAIILRNWILVASALRGTGSGSPVIGAGPLLLLLSGGQFAVSLPGAWEHLWWAPGAAGLVLDPAALPLLVWLLCRRFTRRRK